jgi:hypothetical protein
VQQPLTGTLVIAKPGKTVTATITAGESTITTGALTLSIPDGALPLGTTLTVTEAKVTKLGHQGDYGGAISIVTPLYTIETGGAELDAPVTVTLSMAALGSAADNAVPLAFYYDAETGRLSPLSPVSSDGGSLVSQATHFSAVVGGLIIPDKLPQFADSGFRPGVDDWQTGNWGSYLEPLGHCEAISVSEIWYYLKQHKGADAAPLHDLYDNNGVGARTPDLWQDDSLGYRLTGVLQHGPIADKPLYFGAQAQGWDAADDRLTYAAFLAAISSSGEPQTVYMNTTPKGIAHVMAVYGVTPNWLLVADPNYPGVGRRIRYDPATGKLASYLSASNAVDLAAGRGTTYTRFAYVPRIASMADAAVAAAWGTLNAGTVGDAEFPAYTVQVETGTDAAGSPVWAPLADGYAAAGASVNVRLAAPGNQPLSMKVYQGTSSADLGVWSWRWTLPLVSGDNVFGFYVVGDVSSGPGPRDMRFVDFRRFTIVRADAAAGRWVLTDTVQDGPRETPYSIPGQSLKITATSGSVSVSYNYDGPPHRNQTSTATWGPPPTSAAPGDKWETTLSAQGACAYDLDLSWASGVSVGIMWRDTGEGHSAGFGATATCEKSSEITPVSWAFPAHASSLDDALEIAVQAGGFHGSTTYTYKYTWQP